MLRTPFVLLAAAVMAATGATPIAAAVSVPAKARLVGELGFEGGPYPGGFHPTAGGVEIQFTSTPVVEFVPVGKSGHFNVKLAAGRYIVTGCGPTTSSGPASQCGKPRHIKLTPGQIDHIRLVWALTP